MTNESKTIKDTVFIPNDEKKEPIQFFNQIVIVSLFIIPLGISIYLNATETLKTFEFLAYIVGSLGISFFLGGILLSIIYKLKNYRRTTLGFGLYLISGFSLIIWSILLLFMNKVG